MFSNYNKVPLWAGWMYSIVLCMTLYIYILCIYECMYVCVCTYVVCMYVFMYIIMYVYMHVGSNTL